MRSIACTAPSASVPGWFAMSAQMTSVSEVDAEPHALLLQLRAQLVRVREVAVVAERDRAPRPVGDDRLGVHPVRRAGRRVARMADRRAPGQRLQLALVEDLRDEAHVAHGEHATAVGDGDARRSPARGAAARRARSRPGGRRRGRARGCRRRRTSDGRHRPRQGVVVGRARIVQRRRRARARRSAGRCASPPSAPSRSSGTSAASHALARRSSFAGAQLTTTSPQLSPKSVAAAPSPGSSVASRPAPRGERDLGQGDREAAVGDVVGRAEHALARQLAEQVAEPAQLRAGRPRECARRSRRRRSACHSEPS